MKPVRSRAFWIKNGIGLLMFPLVLTGLVRLYERRQVFAPTREWVAHGNQLGRRMEEVWIETADRVRLNGWFFPSQSSGHSDRAFLVLHGNGGNISHRLGLYDLLLRAGPALLALDYRGYGKSGGSPSEEGLYRDAQAGFRWLRQERKIARVIAVGESLGGGVAAELALREPLEALVLQSTFTSCTRLGAELLPWMPVEWLATIRFDTLSKISRVRMPVLVLHSPEDRLIGFHHAEANHAAASGPKWLVRLHGDHNDPVEWSATAYLRGVQELLEALDGNPAGAWQIEIPPGRKQ